MSHSTTLPSKIFYNTLWQIIIRAIDIIIGIIVLGLLARYLGQSGFGHYTTVTAFLQLIMMLADLGLYLTLLREISARDDESENEIINNVFSLRITTSVLFLIIALFSIRLFPYPDIVKGGVLALSFAYLFMSLITVLTALFQKKLEMPKVAAANLMSKVIFMIFVIWAIKSGGGLIQILSGSSIGAAFGFLLLWLATKKHITLRLNFNWKIWLSIIKKTWPLAATIALNLIYFKADTLILSLYRSADEVGLYGATYRVLEILSAFPHMFMGLILPLMTAAWVAHDSKRLQAIWQKSFDFFSFITLPLIFGSLVLAEPLMKLVAGDQFTASGPILKILMLATAAIFFGTLFSYVVLALDQQKAMIKYFFTAAVAATIGYLSFIPLYGYWAAAWVTVAVEILLIAFAYNVIRKKMPYRPSFNNFFRLLLSSLIMAVIIWPMKNLNLFALLLIGAVTYLLLALISQAIKFSEIKDLITGYRHGTD